MEKITFTAIIEKEEGMFVALCPEVDVASQGTTIEQATANLKEAVELFLECADAAEIKSRLRSGIFVTTFEATHG
jgi:predicted RNase H-like HicB family nuclease